MYVNLTSKLFKINLLNNNKGIIHIKKYTYVINVQLTSLIK